MRNFPGDSEHAAETALRGISPFAEQIKAEDEFFEQLKRRSTDAASQPLEDERAEQSAPSPRRRTDRGSESRTEPRKGVDDGQAEPDA